MAETFVPLRSGAKAACLKITRTKKGPILYLPRGVTADQGADFLRGLREAAAYPPAGDSLAAALGDWVPLWCARLGLMPPRVALTDLPGRWGLCRYAAGEVLLSLGLKSVPLPAAEEVLVHELCHFAHRDHDAAFWQALTDCLPDWAWREGLLRGRREEL